MKGDEVGGTAESPDPVSIAWPGSMTTLDGSELSLCGGAAERVSGEKSKRTHDRVRFLPL